MEIVVADNMSYIYNIKIFSKQGTKMNTTTFTTSQLQSKIGTVLNAVQQEGAVLITGRSRPEMVMMTKEGHDIMTQTAIEQNEKIRQLTAFIVNNDMKEHLEISEAIRKSKEEV